MGRLLFIDSRSAVLNIELSLPPPPPLPLTLLLALPRPKVLKRVLQCAAAMGVKKLVLFKSWRVEKSYWQSPLLEEEKCREQLLLGLEQAGDTILPELMLRKRFKPFVEDELPALAGNTLALLAHPGSPRPCPRKVGRPVTLAIGPEGGFLSYEVDLLMGQGFQPVHLGERILRVEQVVPALLGRLF